MNITSKVMKDLIINNVSFKVIDKLGKGSFGNVYKVGYNGKFYALKVIKNAGKEGIKSLKELDIMTRLIHPNITKAELVVAEYTRKVKSGDKNKKSKSKIGVLMEIAETDLFRAMYEKKFKIKNRIDILRQVSLGIKFLHDSNYLHMDVKPVNVLLFDNYSAAKLTDFGLSLKTEEVDHEKFKNYPIEIVTIDHRSYNILKGDRKYTTADDIWALGITFLEVLSKGKSIFSKFKDKDYTEKKVLKNIVELLSPETISITLNAFLSKLEEPSNAVSLITRMLDFDPKLRSSIDEVLSSPLFNPPSSLSSQFPLLPVIKLPSLTKMEINPPILKSNCDIFTYEGFDVLVRLSSKVAISIETFFLAVDIYHRSLAYRHQLTGDWTTDYNNIVYSASLSLYLAIKMIEPFFADSKLIAKLAGNLFPPEYLLIGEPIIVNSLNGILYPDNFFTSSTTLRRLQEAFEISRNCRKYPNIDLEEWKKLNHNEAEKEEKFNKYSPFILFFKTTSYYKNHFNDSSRDYISKLFKND